MTMMPVVGGLSALKIDQGKSSIENRMQIFIFSRSGKPSIPAGTKQLAQSAI
jgi:hypothetical protein